MNPRPTPFYGLPPEFAHEKSWPKPGTHERELWERRSAREDDRDLSDELRRYPRFRPETERGA